MLDGWLNDLHVHGVDPADPVFDFWLKTPVHGLDSPDVRETVNDKGGEDGVDYTSALYGKRSIPLAGVVQGNTPAAYEANRRLLSDTIRIRRDSRGLSVPVRFKFRTLAGITYFVNAFPGKPVFDLDDPLWTSFMIPLTVAKPQIYVDEQVSQNGMQLPQATGLTFPVAFPATFGGVAQGTYVFDNDGTYETPPVITLYGSLTNPSIVNQTTGQVLQLNYQLSGSDFIRIYMDDSQYGKGKRIMLNDTDSLLDDMADGSEWWLMQPGENVLSFSSGGDGDDGTMDIIFNPAVVGV